MVVKLNGADFSEQNIGTYELPEEINAFTLAAIAASGRTFNSTQKSALNTFFKTLGAFGNESAIWSKLDKVYMPMLAGDLSKAVVNYKTNNVDAVPDASWLELRNRGLAKISGSTTGTKVQLPNTSVNPSNLSVFTFNTVELVDAGANDSPSIGSSAISGSDWKVFGTQGYSGGNSTYILLRFTGNVSIDDNSNISNDNKKSLILRGKSCNGTNVVTLYGGSTIIKKVNSSISLAEKQMTYYPFGVNASGATGSAVPCGASIIGNFLTESECKTLGSAFNALWDAIK